MLRRAALLTAAVVATVIAVPAAAAAGTPACTATATAAALPTAARAAAEGMARALTRSGHKPFRQVLASATSCGSPLTLIRFRTTSGPASAGAIGIGPKPTVNRRCSAGRNTHDWAGGLWVGAGARDETPCATGTPTIAATSRSSTREQTSVTIGAVLHCELGDGRLAGAASWRTAGSQPPSSAATNVNPAMRVKVRFTARS